MHNFGSIILLPTFEPGGPKKRACATFGCVRRVLSLEIKPDYPLFWITID